MCMREELEPAIAGGAVSVTENNGKYSASLDTTSSGGYNCLPGWWVLRIFLSGTYNITVGHP